MSLFQIILVPIFWGFYYICYLKKRSDDKSWTQHSDGEHALIYAVAQQSCTSYPLDNHVNAFVLKMEKKWYFYVLSLYI